MENIGLSDTIISDFAYANRDDITEISLLESTVEIGAGAFHGCKNLTKVVLGPNVKYVKEGAFSDCPKLQYLQFSHGTYFEDHCLNYSSGLQTLVKDDVVARTFYFPVDHQYAVTIKSDKLSTSEYDVYEGRMAVMSHFPNSAVDLKRKILYFVVINQNGVEYSWFDTDLQWAIIGARFKASGMSYNAFFHTTLTLNSRLDWYHYAILIGACSTGRLLWNILVQTIGYSLDEQPTVQEVLDALKSLDANLYHRSELAVARAHIAVNYLDYNKMIPGAWFTENLTHMLTTQGIFVKVPKGGRS